MTEKEKFISEILALVKQPLAGENPIIPTESQIAELQKADGVQDAILIANNFGWSDYVVQWSLNQPTDQQDSVSAAIQAALSGQQTSFLGVDANTVINYGGEVTTVGAFADNFYVDGDQNAPEALMPEEIRVIQADLINAGLLGSKVNRPFRPGVWGKHDRAALYELMSLANQNGEGKAEKGWQTTLQLYLDNPIQEPEQVAAYLPPDYKSVSNSINGLFESELGRKPKDYELKLLAETYLSEAKSAYQQNISLQTPQDIMATAESLEDYGNHIQPVVEEGVTAIDPGARMLDVFNKVTAKEQERLGANRDIQATNRIILNSITGAPE
tara:strand:+ start:2844 stop:3827 length:984 start_codon:yes stop_codon:yes gene_type:complete